MTGLREGCRVVFVTLLMTFVAAGLICLLVCSFIDQRHCRNCGRVVEHENYCPNCGTKTESVLIYDHWDKIKYGR